MATTVEQLTTEIESARQRSDQARTEQRATRQDVPDSWLNPRTPYGKGEEVYRLSSALTKTIKMVCSGAAAVVLAIVAVQAVNPFPAFWALPALVIALKAPLETYEVRFGRTGEIGFKTLVRLKRNRADQMREVIRYDEQGNGLHSFTIRFEGRTEEILGKQHAGLLERFHELRPDLRVQEREYVAPDPD